MSISKRRLRDGTTVYDVREYVGFLDGSQKMALRHFWWVAHLCNDAAGSSER